MLVYLSAVHWDVKFLTWKAVKYMGYVASHLNHHSCSNDPQIQTQIQSDKRKRGGIEQHAILSSLRGLCGNVCLGSSQNSKSRTDAALFPSLSFSIWSWCELLLNEPFRRIPFQLGHHSVLFHFRLCSSPGCLISLLSFSFCALILSTSRAFYSPLRRERKTYDTDFFFFFSFFFFFPLWTE